MRTACDVLREAEKAWMRPDKLTREEVDDLAEALYNLIHEIHSMAESMDNRLQEYARFTKDLVDGINALGID